MCTAGALAVCGVADRGDAGFLDGGSPMQWFDLVVFHRTATPAGTP